MRSHCNVSRDFPVVLGALADFGSGEMNSTLMNKFKAPWHCPNMLNHPSTFPSSCFVEYLKRPQKTFSHTRLHSNNMSPFTAGIYILKVILCIHLLFSPPPSPEVIL